jgi:hypothetical protein
VLVVATDEGYGQRERPPGAEYWPVQASVTFGIAADGVTGVELEASDGSHPAVVSANAFLAVITDPPLGERVRKAFASTSDGHRIPVAVAEAPFGDSGRPATGGEARGPARVEVQVGPGSIGWLERREARGVSAEDAGVDVGRMFGDLGRVAFARVLQPDEQSFYRVLVGVVGGDGNVCVFLIGRQGGGGGCSAGNFPPGRPFNLGVSLERGGEQYATLSGLASDDVARMELFLANGDVVPVPLKDNAFVIQAPRAQFPVRVVAYDDQGRVIGSEVPPSI